MNDEKKDFNAMLHNSKDMPKIKTIDKEEVVSRYGGRKMLLAPPIDYDKVINLNSATLLQIQLFKYLSNKKLLRILPCQIFHLS
ncbi:MAG: hypothetical protein MR891_04435 [Bacteroidales bacterium]|nr:hypothetical protein [Bacteroidales bacterium]